MPVLVVKITLKKRRKYYAFGWEMPGRKFNTENYRHGFNGKENDRHWGDQLIQDYGFRLYNPAIGKFLSVDPLAPEYPFYTPYQFAGNDVIRNIDLDGLEPSNKIKGEDGKKPKLTHRIYYHAGASNDQDGWNYSARWEKNFTEEGISGFTRINVSGGKLADVVFTNTNRTSSGNLDVKDIDNNGNITWKTQRLGKQSFSKYGLPKESWIRPIDEAGIAAKQIKDHISINPIGSNDQLNLIGYSYGSVLMAQAALRLVDDGYSIDNLILVGSPIPETSELFKALTTHKNIGNVIRHDIPGDLLSNPKNNWEYAKGGGQNAGVDGPHFDLARPGKETDDKVKKLANDLKDKGVK